MIWNKDKEGHEINIDYIKLTRSIGLALALFVVFTWVSSIATAKYNIWHQRQAGMAELARADGNRQIVLCEAKAKMESAKCYAEAEIIRARGVAEANKIIGDSLKGNEAYLRYRWIEGMQTTQQSTVYIPTECGLPILEATRSLQKGEVNEKSNVYSKRH